MTLTRKKELARGSKEMKRTEIKPMSDNRRAELAAAGRRAFSTFNLTTTTLPQSDMPRGQKKAKPKTVKLPMPLGVGRELPDRQPVKLTDPTDETVAAVVARDGSACAICAIGLNCIKATRGEEWHCHHRQLRSRGGHHRASNLLLLCPGCHDRAHRDVDGEATANGWIVSATADPGRKRVLVLTADGQRWARLDDNGTRTILKTRVRAGVR